MKPTWKTSSSVTQNVAASTAQGDLGVLRALRGQKKKGHRGHQEHRETLPLTSSFVVRHRLNSPATPSFVITGVRSPPPVARPLVALGKRRVPANGVLHGTERPIHEPPTRSGPVARFAP